MLLTAVSINGLIRGGGGGGGAAPPVDQKVSSMPKSAMRNEIYLCWPESGSFQERESCPFLLEVNLGRLCLLMSTSCSLCTSLEFEH